MLVDVLEFFRNLPAKTCSCCGEILNEQCECYTTECENCDKKETI